MNIAIFLDSLSMVWDKDRRKEWEKLEIGCCFLKRSDDSPQSCLLLLASVVLEKEIASTLKGKDPFEMRNMGLATY